MARRRARTRDVPAVDVALERLVEVTEDVPGLGAPNELGREPPERSRRMAIGRAHHGYTSARERSRGTTSPAIA